MKKIWNKIKEFWHENYKFLLCLIILIFMLYYEMPYVIYRRGGTIDLKDRVIIDTKYTETGTLQMSYVNATKGTPAFLLLSYLLPDWDIVPLEDITDDGDYDEVLKQGKVYLTEGIDNAKIAAFTLAGKNIEIKNTINMVLYLTKEAKTNLEIGDEVLKVNDEKITSVLDIQNIVSNLEENDEVHLVVQNNGKTYERKAILYLDEENNLKIGAAFKTIYDIETEIPVEIKMKSNESGSSGGLMMSLAIYNALTEEDITKGRNIVGTGTIDSSGIVGEIGGVKYKVLGAEKDHADIFLCPLENLEEALDIKKKRNLDVEIIGVHTLEEAISKLTSNE